MPIDYSFYTFQKRQERPFVDIWTVNLRAPRFVLTTYIPSLAGTLSIDEALERPEFHGSFRNMQSFFLGGAVTPALMCDQGFCPAWISPMRKEGLLLESELTSIEIHRRARERLATFDCVATTEQLDRILWLLSHRFGWPPMRNCYRENVNPVTAHDLKTLPARTQARIEELNPYDRDLYEFAHSLCEERFSAMMNHFLSAPVDHFRASILTPTSIRRHCA